MTSRILGQSDPNHNTEDELDRRKSASSVEGSTLYHSATAESPFCAKLRNGQSQDAAPFQLFEPLSAPDVADQRRQYSAIQEASPRQRLNIATRISSHSSEGSRSELRHRTQQLNHRRKQHHQHRLPDELDMNVSTLGNLFRRG